MKHIHKCPHCNKLIEIEIINNYLSGDTLVYTKSGEEVKK